MNMPDARTDEDRMNAIEQRYVNAARSRAFVNISDFFDFRNKKMLDIGCSYGEYLALMGQGSCGVTISSTEGQFIHEKGMSAIIGDIQERDIIARVKAGGPYDVIWANNLFEHLECPHIFLRALWSLAGDATLILGVPVLPRPTCLTGLAKFRGALAAPHINFFTKATLIETVKRAGWDVMATRPFIFRNPVLDALVSPSAPHQYIVAKAIKDFVYNEKRLKEASSKLGELYFPEAL